MRRLVSVNDVTRNQFERIFRATDEIKEEPYHPLLKNKTLAMIFAKPSTRTRVSFETAMLHLGGHAIDLDSSEIQLGGGETIADTAKVLSRYVDGIMARLFKHEDLEELAKQADIPVINGLTDLMHPVQAISDMYTIDEKLGKLRGVHMTFLGDGSSNVCHSLALAASKLGMNMTICCPREHWPNKDILKTAVNNAKLTGSYIEVVTDPKNAVRDSDVLYTDTWISMGQEEEERVRIRNLKSFQLNMDLLKLAKPFAVVMHCLPAHRGQEITSEVMDSPKSIVFDQAENRMHVEKAILAIMLGKK